MGKEMCMQYFHFYHSPLGAILVSSNGHHLTGLRFIESDRPVVEVDSGLSYSVPLVFARTDLWLDTYFDGRVPDFTPPLQFTGSAFSLAVWDLLLKIPYGQTVTYGDIARSLAARTGKKMAAQAVGGAVGRNPISLIVPCHRVVGARGNLGGYAWGIQRKQRLLSLEQNGHSQ